MSYYTDRLPRQGSIINMPCWYQKSYSQDITFSKIKEVNIEDTVKGRTITCLLNNGTIAVLHNHNCPDWIGRNCVWGFLTQEECEEYWDM